MSIGFNRLRVFTKDVVRWHCLKAGKEIYKCKILVVGGGTGGCNVAWRFSRRLKKDIILLEPSDIHYYQPGFTLVAAGLKRLDDIQRPLGSLLPPGVTWLQDCAEHFEPRENVVYTANGNKIIYDFLVVALGLKNDYDKIVGLKQALDDPKSKVSTIYSPEYCCKTWRNIKEFGGGHAVFTSPVVGGKCSGAALKIMYLAHDFWNKHKVRDKTSITFNTANDTTFVVKKYADVLTNLALDRDIVINYCTDLVEVRPAGALFKSWGSELVCFPYNMMHVTPPMSPPVCLSECKELVNDAGYLDVNMYTLQHKCFNNVFGIGDCIGTLNSKTAAAIGPQSYVVERNLLKTIDGEALNASYDGYGACPLLTSYKKGILAEYIYDSKVQETFPFDQSKERRLFYHIKVNILPSLYWRFFIKGKFNGPARLRKILKPLKR